MIRSLLLILTVGLLAAGCKPKREAQSDVAADARHVAPVLSKPSNLTRIAFGSCNHSDEPQPLWQPIMAMQPDAFVWLGDIVYGDTEDMEVLRKKYNMQYRQPDYAKLRKQTRVLGIWDDHDYGVNDGDRTYPKKAESKTVMLDFLDEPANTMRRVREGAYGAYDIGSGDRKVKVILLDCRYFRSPLARPNHTYQANDTGTMLGEKQWQWLEQTLKTSDAAINIIASGVQVIPKDHKWEKWANFPNERKRLFKLIGESQAEGVIFISGDRHIAEVSKFEADYLSYPLYEVTSSGLTHTWSRPGEEANEHRISDLIIELNYGLIDVEWGGSPSVTFTVKGEGNKTYYRKRVTY